MSRPIINVPIIWVLGGPGSGKGTMCKKMVEKYGLVHLSSGDLLRNEVSTGSARGKEIADIMAKGELVETQIVLDLLKQAIQKNLSTAKGFLIDGYPREQEQAVLFEQQIGDVSLLLFIDASDETLIKRLTGRAATSGRADDNEETIKTRIRTFHEHTNKILSAYESRTRRINGEPAPNEAPELQRLQYDMTALDSHPVPIVWIVGPPGTGRHIQAEAIAENRGFENILVANLLRTEAQKHTNRGTLIKDCLRGTSQKLRNEIVIDLIKEEMLLKANSTKGFILNGFPRSNKQANLFVKEVADVDVIIYLYSNIQVMISREQHKKGNQLSSDTTKLQILDYTREVKNSLFKFGAKIEKICTDGPPGDVFGRIEAAINVRLNVKSSIPSAGRFKFMDEK